MGLVQGKTDANPIIVEDVLALPVEGTGTRVNAQADAYEYMADYSQTNKQFQEPFLAVVIDPTRTVSAIKVEIGAFRTYPEGYKPPDYPMVKQFSEGAFRLNLRFKHEL
ncbi:hypothetical protein V6N13_113064 [Hibiscus sabdariffa]